jgi:hypothetical protein
LAASTMSTTWPGIARHMGRTSYRVRRSPETACHANLLPLDPGPWGTFLR